MAKDITTTTNGTTLTIITRNQFPIIIDTTILTEDMVQQAALHGLKQKIVDAAAKGSEYTLTERYQLMVDMAARIKGGTWNVKGSGDGTGTTGLLALALVRHTGKDLDYINSYLKGLDKKQQAALRNNPAIAAIIETIKAGRVKTTGINSDALLAGLMEGMAGHQEPSNFEDDLEGRFPCPHCGESDQLIPDTTTLCDNCGQEIEGGE